MNQKKNRKPIFWLCLLCCALLCTGLASADAIVEPRDRFYERHADECVYLYRSYTVNGAEGYAALWESPVSDKQTEIIANGEVLGCSFLYTDDNGETWGGVWGESDTLRGWLRLSDTVALPDYLSFEEAHGEEFTGFDPIYSDVLQSFDTVLLWRYPGVDPSTFPPERANAAWFRDNVTPAEVFTTCYTDPEGRFWGFISYCYGIRNTWVCLSDPGNDALSPIPDIIPAEAELIPPTSPLPAPDDGKSLPLAALLVLAVVTATAILIPLLFRKKKG